MKELKEGQDKIESQIKTENERGERADERVARANEQN